MTAGFIVQEVKDLIFKHDKNSEKNMLKPGDNAEDNLDQSGSDEDDLQDKEAAVHLHSQIM